MILFVLPPLTQLNTPYPSITHLTGYLRSRGIEAEQMDLGIELINRLFTRVELSRVFDVVESKVESRELLCPEAARCRIRSLLLRQGVRPST